MPDFARIMRNNQAVAEAEERIKASYVKSWHKPQTDTHFDLSDLDGLTFPDHYASDDRDGKLLRNGQVKTFPDYNGRIRKGRIYHNINNMWWVIAGNGEVFNRASFDFVDDKIREKLVRMVPVVSVRVSRRPLRKRVAAK